MNGKLAAALDLKTLAGRTHLYGLGPIEQLRGEARVAPDGTVNVTDSFDAGVPFFVWAEVPHWVVCHERRTSLCAARNCTRDEGGPFEFGDQEPISSHHKLLRAKAVVVSVAETPGQDFGRHGRERRAQANRCRSVESGLGDVRTGG